MKIIYSNSSKKDVMTRARQMRDEGRNIKVQVVRRTSITVAKGVVSCTVYRIVEL